MKRKVLVVDDHPIVRQGLAEMINREPDLSVCGDAADMQKAVASHRGVEARHSDRRYLTRRPRRPRSPEAHSDARPTLPVLILSMHDESIYAERALRAGANGYIMKQEATDNVLDALRRILNREIYVSPRITNKMLQQFVGGTNTDKRHSSVDDLSDRELEVLRLIGAGHGTRQIAEELHLSVKTVETYQAHLKEKLVLRNSRELVQYATRWMMGARAATT